MLFVEPRFFVFFLVAFAVHWSLRSHRARKVWLLGCSYVFYGAWDERFLGLILASTLIDFVVGRGLGRTEGARARKAWLSLSLAANLTLLGFFKYFGFFTDSAAELIGWLGFQPNLPTLEILLPVGISFYTFQTLSYTIDVYRRKLSPTNDLADFAMFVAFFPQLVAGPIVRAIDFLPQLDRARVFARDVHVRRCLTLFLIGFVKKAVLADNVAIAVDAYFDDPAGFTSASTWLAMLLYQVQVYGDFSGYTDMALGAAGLLGYRLAPNFDFPFFATSATAFWRRWHISLSTWFRDYLYVALGGNRVSRLRLVLNVYVTLLCVGLWHGAGWNFVVFGLMHGTYLLVHQGWRQMRREESALARVIAVLALPLTYFFLILSWPFFRGASSDATLTTLGVMLGFEPGGAQQLSVPWFAICAAFVCLHWVFFKRFVTPSLVRVPAALFAFGYGVAWALVLPLVATGYKPFVYFQF